MTPATVPARAHARVPARSWKRSTIPSSHKYLFIGLLQSAERMKTCIFRVTQFPSGNINNKFSMAANNEIGQFGPNFKPDNMRGKLD